MLSSAQQNRAPDLKAASKPIQKEKYSLNILFSRGFDSINSGKTQLVPFSASVGLGCFPSFSIVG